MAHTCPECGQYCTCNGDWDDIDFGEDLDCIHCPAESLDIMITDDDPTNILPQGEKMSDKVEQYEHHGVMVSVMKEVKGKHRKHCLCFLCTNFHPGAPETNCPIANLNYAVCLANNVVLPVYECPLFKDAG